MAIWTLTGLYALVAIVSTAHGAEPARQMYVSPFVDAQYFQWQEHLNGSKVVDESGPRAALGLNAGNLTRLEPGLVGEIEAAVYGGEVDYEGQTQDGVPLDTDTDYLGGYVEGTLGYRLPMPPRQHAIDVLASFGLDLWERDIANASDSLGRSVLGLKEDYRVWVGRLGVGLFSRWVGWLSHVHVGVKYPLDAKVDVSEFGVTLKPKRDPSVFARMRAWHPGGASPGLGFMLYYESYRFDDSPTEQGRFRDLPVRVFQPESDMDTVGLRLSYSF